MTDQPGNISTCLQTKQDMVSKQFFLITKHYETLGRLSRRTQLHIQQVSLEIVFMTADKQDCSISYVSAKSADQVTSNGLPDQSRTLDVVIDKRVRRSTDEKTLSFYSKF